MDFIKKNYEKVLLGAVLIGLGVAVAFLPLKISSEKQKLQDLTATVTHQKARPLTNLDLTVSESALKRVATTNSLSLTPPNKLFSPMPWQKTADNKLVPLDDSNMGPKAVNVLKLTPLYLTLTLDSIQALDSGARYLIGIRREAALNVRDRDKKQAAATAGYKHELFSVQAIQGPAENPTNIVLELKDGTLANLSKEKPFRRVDGYTADLRYAPENKTWRNKRVGEAINLQGEDYNIVAINESEVVLSAKTNQKKWTVKYSPSATPEPRQ